MKKILLLIIWITLTHNIFSQEFKIREWNKDKIILEEACERVNDCDYDYTLTKEMIVYENPDKSSKIIFSAKKGLTVFGIKSALIFTPGILKKVKPYKYDATIDSEINYKNNIIFYGHISEDAYLVSQNNKQYMLYTDYDCMQRLSPNNRIDRERLMQETKCGFFTKEIKPLRNAESWIYASVKDNSGIEIIKGWIPNYFR